MRVLALAALLATGAGARAADYRIETELDPPRAYVGSQVVLRHRLLRAPGLPYGVLRPPQLGDAAEVSPLGFQPDYRAERAGRSYQVRERAYLIVPLRAGPLAVPAPVLDGPLAARVRPARAAPRVLEVRAPRAAPGEPWLPARSLVLEEAWSRDPAALAAGEPVVRTLVVRAEGITGNRLPALEMAPQPELAAHHEADRFRSVVLPSGMGGWRERRVVLMPREEGRIELPAISLAWWDVRSDAPRVATLPARTLRVGPSAAPAPLGAPAEEAALSPLAAMRWMALAVFVLAASGLWAYARGEDQRVARGRLRAACRQNDARGARDALLDWRKALRPGAPLPLVQRLADGWDDAARAQLAALDAALYAGRAWDGKAFWKRVRPWLARETGRRTAPPPDALPPLFRLQAPRRASDLNS